MLILMIDVSSLSSFFKFNYVNRSKCFEYMLTICIDKNQCEVITNHLHKKWPIFTKQYYFMLSEGDTF